MSIRNDLQKLYIGYLGRAADKPGLDYWEAQIQAGAITLEDLRINWVNEQPEYLDMYAGLTRSQTAAKIYENLFKRAPDDAGLDYWVSGEGAAVPVDRLILAFMAGAQGTDVLELDNQVTVANYYTANIGDLYSIDTARNILKMVSYEANSVAAAIAQVDAWIASGVDGKTYVLTLGQDNIVGTGADDVFKAPIVQNQLGAVVNTLETGDVLDGGGGRNILEADLMSTSTTFADGWAPAISPTTVNIQEVYFRAQAPAIDLDVNQSTIDAENMMGVEQWWSQNSRADIQIEDIRSRPDDTAFGMRQTDPGVSYFNYFNALYIRGDVEETASSITISLVDLTNPELELQNITVNSISFVFNGVEYVLQSDEIAAADTYAEFIAAIQAALAEEPALAGLEFIDEGDGVFVLRDPASGVFETGDLSTSTPGNIDLRARQEIGEPIVIDLPVSTTVVLDAAGNGSVGGDLDIGSMSGTAGVEIFNVLVDRASHLTSMASTNFRTGDEYLEEVNLASIGANGDLKLGVPTDFLDGRVVDGLTDVRTVDGSEFLGNLNIGITLTDDSIGRYLDPATEQVDFNYTAGNGNDNFTILVDDALSSDPDFAMNVFMGDGDDRLNIDVETASNVTVDGGEGENVIAVSRSHGTDDDNTFAGFTRFQTYEIEGDQGFTEHNFTSMPGVENVVIATEGGVDTDLIDLEDGTVVTINGKNQTRGNNSNADQFFGEIGILAANGSTLDVVLQNTARIDGVLEVDTLLIADETLTNTSAVRTLNLTSAGARGTSNVVNQIDAEWVHTFNLDGTQNLDATIVAAARSTAPAGSRNSLVVDGTEMTGDLDLTILSDIVTAIDAASNRFVTLTGTEGENDRLTLDGDIVTTADTTIRDFETIRFVDGGGEFDAVNVSGVTLYDIDSLNNPFAMINLRGVETVRIAADGAADDDISLSAAGRASSNVMNVQFDDYNVFLGDVVYTSTLSINDYRTINLDFAGEAGEQFNWDLDLELLGYEVGANEFANYARVLNITGGEFDLVGANRLNIDTLIIDDITASLTTIDLRGWNGDFEGSFGEVLDQDGVAYVNQADFVSNTTIRVNEYNFTWDNATNLDTITSFRFTADAWDDTVVWEITNFNAFNDAGVGLGNVSVLDLRDLGVTGLADITIADDGADTTITSNEGLNFEIVLIGVLEADLANENFFFTA